MIEVQDIVLVIMAYLVGSIPSSVWIGKRFYGTDVRDHGSKNPGATNTLRTLGKKAGFIVLLVDILKGWLAVSLVCLSSYPSGSSTRIHLEVAMAISAIIGHIFPIYAGFRGGKGVATTMGIIMGISPPIALLCIVVFSLVLIVFHYVSLASMIAVISFPVWMAYLYKASHPWLVAFSIILPVLVIITHRKNISRLLKKEESELHIFQKKVH